MGCSVGVYKNAHRLCNPYGVGDLYLDAVGNPGRHEVLGYVSCGVGGAAVHLARVFPRKGTSAVGAVPPVGINYDLSPGEAGIAVGSPYHELSGGVYMEYEIVVEKLRHMGVQGLFEAGEKDGLHIFAYPAALHVFIVLGGEDQGVYPRRGAVVVVLHRELALCVGAQVGHRRRIFPPYGGEEAERLVGEAQGEGHIVGGVVAGEPEHHPLVARPLLAAVHPEGYVGALLVQGRNYGARIGVEAVFTLGIAYLADGAADDILYVDIGLVGGHFATDDGEAGAHEGFAGHPCVGVLAEEIVEYGIRDLVGDFVGMPL